MKAIHIVSLILMLAIGVTMVGTLDADARSHGKKAWRSGSGMMTNHMLEKFATALNLSTEQKQEIAAIVAKYRVARQEKRQELWNMQRALMQKILTEDLDEATIRAEYQNIAAENEARFVAFATMQSDIKAVLTEDQLNTFQEKSTEWFQNRSTFSKHKKHDWKSGYTKKK
jgi:Spy/CpxP family protein refolding chaperone